MSVSRSAAYCGNTRSVSVRLKLVLISACTARRRHREFAPAREGQSATLPGVLRFELSDGCHLRLLEESDADELFALIDLGRDHLSRWLPWAAAQDLEGTLEFIRLTRRRLAENTGFTVAIVCDGAVAGVVGLEPLDSTHRSTSIGYWLGERCRAGG